MPGLKVQHRRSGAGDRRGWGGQHHDVGNLGFHQGRANRRLARWILGGMVLSPASFPQQDYDGAGGDHGAAPAQCHYEVCPGISGLGGGQLHRWQGRTGLNGIEHPGELIPQRILHPVQQIGLVGHRLAADHENALGQQAVTLIAQTGNDIGSPMDPDRQRYGTEGFSCHQCPPLFRRVPR